MNTKSRGEGLNESHIRLCLRQVSFLWQSVWVIKRAYLGINANTLHYIANDSIIQDGEVILVDAGGEYNNFVSDITRTWPVNGRYLISLRKNV